MAAPIPLTEAQVRALASSESFDRGREYFERGAVETLVRRGDRLEAAVAGSAEAPYQVAVTFGPAGIVAESCTCPYDWGGACKHVVATLLAYLDAPDAVEERPPLAAVLAPLDRDQLQHLVLTLAANDPALAAQVELQVTTLLAAPARGTAGRPRPRPPVVDPADLRRQVRAAVRSLARMRSSEAYWHVGGAVRQVVQLAEQARPFFEAGDLQTAWTVLEAVTEEYLAVWMELDGSSGESADGFDELGALWAEAFLSGDLTRSERDHWEDRLADWQTDLDDYGVEDAFVLADTALQEGWDDPGVVRALRGEAPGAAGGGSIVNEPALIDIRLRVLERQGRTDEYLRLAAGAGRRAAYAAMLLRLGRSADAVEYGTTRLQTPTEAQALAQALYGQGAVTEALRVAEHGLTLETPRVGYGAAAEALDDEREEDSYDDAEMDLAEDLGIEPGADYGRATLARWLRDVAHAAGQPEVALRAAAQAVRDDPTLADYLGAQALAGDAWPALRAELLAHVRGLSTFKAQAKADIFLHEGLLDDAVAVADAAPYFRELVEQVADAVLATQPAWVIKMARARAEAIIEGGHSGEYEAAARWLARWRDAAREPGAARAWRAYLDDVLERHRRKYKLMPLLRALVQ